VSWTFGVRRSAFGVPLALLLAACAPRVEVVDASNGLPVAATVRTLPGGAMLVEAGGYETWSGSPRLRVELHPLWLARFADEKPARRRDPPPPCPGCPGKAR